jgi:hypothetical protein|nr:MAG TPA: hypothetical protein [Caudoviricetes sp.]
MIEVQGTEKENHIELNMLELSIALSLLYQDSYARDVPDFLEDLQKEKIIVRVDDYEKKLN